MTLDHNAETTRRIAGAPISWGVCEVPDWGIQLPAERVLAEMQELGLQATEFGPAGFLPDSPEAKAEFLARFDLNAVGGFLPVLLHDAGHEPLPEIDAFIDDCLAAGAPVVVLAAITGVDGYDDRPVLDELQWKTMLNNLDRIADHAESRGVIAVVHPHIGTMVENADDVSRILIGSHIGLCIDTGHLVAAGADPVAITAANPQRVQHVHLKDVDGAVAAKFLAKELTFSEAVSSGLFCVLGTGSVDLTSMIGALDEAGYDGWYVLEQDVMLTAAEAGGEGPITDVRASLDY
ncbi:MAG: TIM barrel protein, partial [Actinomycetota bacterium]|nr:TIM barrel protein [Actinomycetota bacterium]